MNLDMLEQLTRLPGVAGNESDLATWLAEQLRPHASRLMIDRVGNVYAWRGENPKVAIFSHMDGVGFIVNEKGEDFVKVIKVGGPRSVKYAPIVIETAQGDVYGTLLADDEGKNLMVDLWEPATAEQIELGDLAAFAPNFHTSHDGALLHSRWLDNRLGVWVAFEAWQKCEQAIFVATVREESQPNGARVAAHHAEGMEVAVVVDITYSSGPEEPYMVTWGKGPALSLKDRHLYDRRWTKAMMQVARDNKLPFQHEIIEYGGTDATAINEAGYPAIFVGLPIRYAHTPAEVTRLVDCETAVTLIEKFVERHAEVQL